MSFITTVYTDVMILKIAEYLLALNTNPLLLFFFKAYEIPPL